MSWWTKNRKKVGLAAGLLALPFIPGVGAMLGGLGGLFGGGGAAAGAAGVGAGAGAAGAGAGAGASGLLGSALIPAATEMTAAVVPGLSATGAGSQAAMLAAQNAGFGLPGLAATAQAGAGAQGVGMGAKMGAEALAMGSKGLGALGNVASAAGPASMGIGLLSPQPIPQSPPPPPAPQSPPQSSFAGYGGGGMDLQKLLSDPSIPEEIKQRIRQQAMGRMS